MARKQSDYLADLLSGEEEKGEQESGGNVSPGKHPSPAPHEAAGRRPSARSGMTLLGRESALARVASGEVRQVTQLRLDPARVRIWAGNARMQDRLSEDAVRDLIDSILAEGGQKVPVIVRKVHDDDHHDYEVIAGTRRHFAISWLRANSYPDMTLLAQLADLDDEAAFRLADIENRARKDVSDIERARNYASALASHYGGHQTRMAERLKLSKGWLSKMLKVATLPDTVVSAFADLTELGLKPAYQLTLALDKTEKAPALLDEARLIADEQSVRIMRGETPFPASEVLKRLLSAGEEAIGDSSFYQKTSAEGRPLVTLLSRNRQGITLRLHTGTGLSADAMARIVQDALKELDTKGMGLQK